MKIIQYIQSVLFLALFTVICVGGCANDTGIAPQTKGMQMEIGKGTLLGKVTRGPISPIEEKDIPSSVPAVEVKLLILTQEGQVFESVVTDNEGGYSIILPAGSYRIEIEPLPSGFTKDLPATVSITENKETRLDIRIDTGIR